MGSDSVPLLCDSPAVADSGVVVADSGKVADAAVWVADSGGLATDSDLVVANSVSDHHKGVL